MLLLCLFALLAGAGTAVSPCVLPVLPALLSAGATGGRRRPVGIVLGLAVTFTITIVGLATVADGVGLGDGATRDIAIVALGLFGLATLVPAIGDRLEAPLSHLARFGPRSKGSGFASGLLVGAALGFVYAPCAGPILAAVIAVSAASGNTVLVGVSYAIGSSAVLLVLALGGRVLLDRVRGSSRIVVQRTLGAILIATAVAMAFSVDIRFQSAIADHLPAAVVDPTHSLETSGAVADRLAKLHGPSRFQVASTKPTTTTGATGTSSSLPKLGRAPDFTGTQQWFNTPNDTALSLKQLTAEHRVVLVDFWTYTCINCIRTLPYLKAWDAKYRDAGLTIVGVHSPEFPFEKKAGNVAAAIKQDGLEYPVVQDNDLATWNAYSNQYWPAEYLIDATGEVRRVAFGEGDYDKQEKAIRSLLAERGAKDLGSDAKPRGVVTPSALTSPETYIGSTRAQGWAGTPPTNGTRSYSAPSSLPLNAFALSGTWTVTGEDATAGSDAKIDAEIQGRRAYLVLSSPGDAPRTVRVLLDGKPYSTVTVTKQKLYTLIDEPRNAKHHLTLELPRGVSGYAFTFG